MTTTFTLTLRGSSETSSKRVTMRRAKIWNIEIKTTRRACSLKKNIKIFNKTGSNLRTNMKAIVDMAHRYRSAVFNSLNLKLLLQSPQFLPLTQWLNLDKKFKITLSFRPTFFTTLHQKQRGRTIKERVKISQKFSLSLLKTMVSQRI